MSHRKFGPEEIDEFLRLLDSELTRPESAVRRGSCSPSGGSANRTANELRRRKLLAVSKTSRAASAGAGEGHLECVRLLQLGTDAELVEVLGVVERAVALSAGCLYKDPDILEERDSLGGSPLPRDGAVAPRRDATTVALPAARTRARSRLTSANGVGQADDRLRQSLRHLGARVQLKPHVSRQSRC